MPTLTALQVSMQSMSQEKDINKHLLSSHYVIHRTGCNLNDFFKTNIL